MKKAAFLAILLSLSLLTGCGASVFENYREVSELETVRTVGVDAQDGSVSVCADTGVGLSGSKPRLFSGKGAALALAMEEIRRMPQSRHAIFGHTENIVIGEAAAKNGLSGILDYAARSTELRLGTDIYIVHGGTAEDAVTKSSGEKTSASDVLEFLKRESKRTGGGFPVTCGEAAAQLASSGTALIPAVSLKQSGEKSAGGEENAQPTLKSSGFAVIKDGRLAFFVPEASSRAVSILKNKLEYSAFSLPDEKGGAVALAVTKASSSMDAEIFGGAPRFDVDVKLSLAVLQTESDADLKNDDLRRELERRAERFIERELEDAVSFSQKMGVDFLGFGEAMERKEPVLFAEISENWDGVFQNAAVNIRVTAETERTYDIDRPLSLTGGGVQFGKK